MKPKDEYISISEFAKFVNLSPASIYKRIKAGDESLLTFVTEINGKKRINKKALKLYVVNCDEVVTSPVDNQLTTGDTQLIRIYEENMAVLKAELEARNQQLAKKDEQIDAYIIQIAELNDHLKSQTRLVQESHFIAAAGQKIDQIEDVNPPPATDTGPKGFRGWLARHLK